MKVKTILLLCFLVMFSACRGRRNHVQPVVPSGGGTLPPPTYDIQDLRQNSGKQEIIFDQGLTLQGTTQKTYKDKILTIKGNLLLKEDAKLELENAVLYFEMPYNFAYKLDVKDQAALVLKDVIILTNDKWTVWDYNDHARAFFSDLKSNDPYLAWNALHGDAWMEVSNSDIGVTLMDKSFLSARDGTVFIEFVFSPGMVADISLPKQSGSLWEFPKNCSSCQNIDYQVEVRNSKFSNWGVTIESQSKVTLRDADPLTVGIGVGVTGNRGRVDLTNLKSGKQSKQFQVDGADIDLSNVNVISWYPIANGLVELHVSDSEVADFQTRGRSISYVKASTLALVAAHNESVVHVEDTTIHTSVLAENNSTVYLKNIKDSSGASFPKSKIQTRDSGQVFLDGTNVKNIP